MSIRSLLVLLGLASTSAAAPPAAPAAPPPVAPPAAPPTAAPAPPVEPDWKTLPIWTLDATTLEGKPATLEPYRGKVALVVNVASECGLTPQYEALQRLADEYKERGLIVLGFPCNDFGNQEPGSPETIRAFCTSKFKVTFPLFAKVSVKPGDSQAPLYRALAARTGKTPRWNFGKYLVARDGVKAEFFDSKIDPDSKEFRAALEALLAAK